ncbi:MAG: ArsR family transcriptional regulator, partial [Cytophagaceae bacterium]
MHQIIKHHNEHQTYLADTIRLGTLATMETLVNTACKQLRVHLKSVISIDNDELPPIYTNRQEIADLAKCGPRTVYDHLERLRKVGLIRKVFRGRKHDFKVWINPWILLGAVFEPPALIDLDSARNRPSTPAMRQISPLQNTLEGNNNLPN